MRKIFFLFLAISFSYHSQAQISKKDKKEQRKQRINAMIKQEEEGVIAYRKQTVFGAKLTNDGYGAFLEIGRSQSVKNAWLFQLDIAERKHPKESKQALQGLPTSPFIFGKINFFYPIKLGVQKQFLLGNKSNKNGVSVTANVGGGLVLGLLRPYYLEVTDNVANKRINIKYESADSLTFKNGDSLRAIFVTASKFSQGWGDLKISAGLYAKAAVRFDYGRFNEMVNALEVGISAEYYGKKIPQMVFSAYKQFFINAYVALVIGKRK